MGCACAGKTAPSKYVWTAPNGSTKVVNSEVEARSLVARRGGTYKAK